jgi:hypothetical protein
VVRRGAWILRRREGLGAVSEEPGVTVLLNPNTLRTDLCDGSVLPASAIRTADADAAEGERTRSGPALDGGGAPDLFANLDGGRAGECGRGHPLRGRCWVGARRG